MSNKFEYIEFHLNDKKTISDFLRIYKLVSNAKNNGISKPLEYWIEIFPDYALRKFNFRKDEAIPGFELKEPNAELWYFSGLIELIQSEIDITYIDCLVVGEKGILKFGANNYPYGGITGLTMWLNSFGLKAREIDEGGGLYLVNWISDDDFELKEIERSNVPIEKKSKKSRYKTFFRNLLRRKK